MFHPRTLPEILIIAFGSPDVLVSWASQRQDHRAFVGWLVMSLRVGLYDVDDLLNCVYTLWSPHLSKLRQVEGIPRYTWALQALRDSCAT